jgi:peptidylprolyl isomerase
MHPCASFALSASPAPVRARAATPIAATLLALFAATGCGGSDSAYEAPNSITTAQVGPAHLIANKKGPGPEVVVPKDSEPKKLIVVELKEGSGAEARVGDKVALRYVGVEWDGAIHSNSWTSPEAPTFKLGTIALSERGLDEGIRGMKVGGRREVAIPANRRYYPGVEGATHDPIFYVVDLVKVFG